MDLENKSRRLQAENERMRRHLCALQRDVTKLKDEKCDLYVRYTAAMEEKSAMNKRLHDLNLQVGDAHSKILKMTKIHFSFLKPETVTQDQL